MLLAAKVSVQFWSNAFETFSPRVLSSRGFLRTWKSHELLIEVFPTTYLSLNQQWSNGERSEQLVETGTATRSPRRLYRACMLTVIKDSQFSRRISELLNCSYFRWKLVGLFFFCGFRDRKTKFAGIEAGSLSRLAARSIAMLASWAVISASCYNPLTATNNR